jgi:lysyl-tRNA synthetase class 2
VSAGGFDPRRHADRRPFLTARAAIARAVRGWFEAQGFIEVEPAMLVVSPGAETHIAAVAADGGYLHTSPEFAMKKLLAGGETKIFSLGKVWRRGEVGPLHAPEFTMLEWYRMGAPLDAMMRDCAALAQLACATAPAFALCWKGRACDPFAPAEIISTQTAFARAGFRGDLYAQERAYFSDFGAPARTDNTWSDLFSHALATRVEPHLGVSVLSFLNDYPAAEAALARKRADDPRIALRFEMYACGVELANGFDELTDPIEQRARLIAAMDEKQNRYGERWPLDEDFLAALPHMPQTSGVAMGFDRLVMLACGAPSLAHVLW